MVTLGKAAGVAGAAVAAHAVVIDWLVNSARPFIFTTSTSPLLAHTVQASLRLMADEPERRAPLRARMAELKHQLAGLPWTLLPSDTPIQPAADWRQRRCAGGVGRAARARHLGAGHSPATVPPGSARLRIALSPPTSRGILIRLADAFLSVVARPWLAAVRLAKLCIRLNKTLWRCCPTLPYCVYCLRPRVSPGSLRCIVSASALDSALLPISLGGWLARQSLPARPWLLSWRFARDARMSQTPPILPP